MKMNINEGLTQICFLQQAHFLLRAGRSCRFIACQVVLLKLAILYFRGLAGSRSGELPLQNDPAMCSVMTLRSYPVEHQSVLKYFFSESIKALISALLRE